MSKERDGLVGKVSSTKGPIGLYMEVLRSNFTQARSSGVEAQQVRSIRDDFTKLNHLLHGYNFSDTQKKPNAYFSEKKYQDTKTGVIQYIEDLKEESKEFSDLEQGKAQKIIQLLEDALKSFDAKNTASSSPIVSTVPSAFSESMNSLKTLKATSMTTRSHDENSESIPIVHKNK